MASAAALAAFKPIAGYSPIVARVCLPVTSRNRTHPELAPAAVSRRPSPLQATSLSSRRRSAGGIADRSNASVRRTFKGNLEIARPGARWGLTGGTNRATARDHGRKRAYVIHALTLV